MTKSLLSIRMWDTFYEWSSIAKTKPIENQLFWKTSSTIMLEYKNYLDLTINSVVNTNVRNFKDIKLIGFNKMIYAATDKTCANL